MATMLQRFVGQPEVPVTTCTGVVVCVVLLLPSWPLPAKPQSQTVPSDMSAILWYLPVATATILQRLVAQLDAPVSTCTGVMLHAVALHVCGPTLLLSPSWPLMFRPQAQTVPSDFSARFWASPAEMAKMPVKVPDPPTPNTYT